MSKYEKGRCKVFTPQHYVELMLDLIGYKDNLFGKKILENSCGDGVFLVEIVKRYIVDCRKNKISNQNIIEGLKKDVVGIEIDKDTLNKCKYNLECIFKEMELEGAEIQLFEGDYLSENFEYEFDYIVSNPPYVSYKNMGIEKRKFMRNTFETCKKGKFDYYYGFIEKSFNELKNNGKMTYIVPNNVFKNIFAEDLRNLIKNNLVSVIDNFSSKVFYNACVVPVIFFVDKGKNNDYIEYVDNSDNKQIVVKEINKDRLIGKKWAFSENYEEENVTTFGDKYIVGHTIATLSNDIFLLNSIYEKDNGFFVNGLDKIEEKIVRKAVSPNSIRRNIQQHIIFPYEFKENNLRRYTVEEFEGEYPNASKYLKKNIDRLEKRDVDKGCAWYEYGRSQAITNMNNEKLMLSIIVTKDIKLYKLDKETIPYSGIYIVSKYADYDLNRAIKILKDKKFSEYIKKIGTRAEGSSIKISANDIKKYKFKE